MRLTHFPEPEPDELLYSVLARYGRHLGLEAPGAVAEQLFGSGHLVAVLDLPCQIGTLAVRIGDATGLDAGDIVDRHTLFPYHAAFRSDAKRSLARAAMIGDGRSLHFRLGAAAARVHRPRHLHFCPTCLGEATRQGSEPYWRRAHQLPGVLVCPDHGCVLRRGVDLAVTSRHAYVAATAATCPADAPSLLSEMSPTALERLCGLARASAALLDAREGETPVAGSAASRDRLASLGLMRSERKVDVAAFEAAFSEFYHETLDHLPIDLPDRSRSDWIAELLRASRDRAPTLVHLVLRCFLDGSTPAAARGDRAPWTCPNPLASHRGERVVTDVVRRPHRGTVTGTFTCSCGYSYRRRMEGGSAVGPHLFKAYGPTLDPELRRLTAAGMSQRAVAKAVGLDVKTMNRQATSLGVPLPWLPCQAEVAQDVGRAAPGDGLAPPPGPSVKSPRRRGPPPFDWAAADRSVTDRLVSITADIMATDPPTRVTVAELERRLTRKAWLNKRRDRLPEAHAFISGAVESVERFRERRIRACIRRVGGEGRPPAAWKVMRAVGLDGGHLPRILSLLADTDHEDGSVRADTRHASD